MHPHQSYSLSSGLMLSFGLPNSIWINLVSLYTTCPELRQPVTLRTGQNSSCYDVGQLQDAPRRCCGSHAGDRL